MDVFIGIVRGRELVSESKLDRLLQEHDSPNNKKRESQLPNTVVEKEIPMESVMEEEKMNEDLPYFRHSEITQS